MEQVEKFDKRYKKQEDYNFLLFSVGKYIFLAIGLMLMLLPEAKSDKGMGFIITSLLGWSMICHIRPYMVVVEDGKQTTIYKKLKWMPVNKKDIQKVRGKYLGNYIRKLFAVALLEQIVVSVLAGCFSIFTLLYAISIVAAVTVIGILCIVLPDSLLGWKEK